MLKKRKEGAGKREREREGGWEGGKESNQNLQLHQILSLLKVQYKSLLKEI